MVIAPLRGAEGLAEALAALRGQRGAPPFEVVLPVDAPGDAARGLLRDDGPPVRLVPVEGNAELASASDPGAAHLALDRRRAAGLAAARAPLVALTDASARPGPDWCAQLVQVHRAPHAVVGGPVENVRDRALNWALFFMDAGRYQAPLPEGPAAFVTDLNVCYKRAALEATDVWRERYHETGLHDALRARGETLWLSPLPLLAVDRGPLRLSAALRERFAWARLYAGRRAREVPPARRLLLALGAPAIGPLFLLRQLRLAHARGRHVGALWRALPLLALLDLVWSAGEAVGYSTGRATSEAGA